MSTEPVRGIEALRIVLEHLPREEDGTATIVEVAQRRSTALGYLEEVEVRLGAAESGMRTLAADVKAWAKLADELRAGRGEAEARVRELEAEVKHQNGWAHDNLRRAEKAEAERDELRAALEWLKDNAHDEEALSERAACADPFHTERQDVPAACPTCSSTWWAVDGSLPEGAAYAVEAVARAALHGPHRRGQAVSALVRCMSCQHGDHSGHHEIVQSVPQGMLGGARCPCKGECAAPTVGVRPCPYCEGDGCEECDGTGERHTTILETGDRLTLRVHGSASLSPEAQEALAEVARVAFKRMDEGGATDTKDED